MRQNCVAFHHKTSHMFLFLFCFVFWSCVCRTLALPDQGLNPYPLQQEHGVLTTGQLGEASLMF